MSDNDLIYEGMIDAIRGNKISLKIEEPKPVDYGAANFISADDIVEAQPMTAPGNLLAIAGNTIEHGLLLSDSNGNSMMLDPDGSITIQKGSNTLTRYHITFQEFHEQHRLLEERVRQLENTVRLLGNAMRNCTS